METWLLSCLGIVVSAVHVAALEVRFCFNAVTQSLLYHHNDRYDRRGAGATSA